MAERGCANLMFSLPSEPPLPPCLYKYEGACICTATSVGFIWLWALISAVEVEIADRLHQGSSRVEAGTQAAQLKLRDTVTNRCSILRRIQEHLTISSLTCPPADASVHKRCYFVGVHSSWVIQDVASSLSLGGIPKWVGPFLCSCSSHFLTIFLSLLYYLLAITHSSVCYSPLKASVKLKFTNSAGFSPISKEGAHPVNLMVDWFYSK